MVRTRRWPRLLTVTLLSVAALFIAACGVDTQDLSPGGDRGGSPEAQTDELSATPTAAAALRVVTPTPVVAVATEQPGASGTSEVVQENAETYVIQEGDTLYSVALRFAVGLDQLILLNGLSDPNDIIVGQELKIPPRG